MYNELIEKLNPKPKFNLEWYKDEDLYSDGPVEDTIINIIAENEPEKYTDAILNKMSWPTYYHLTHLRKNILNWYPFDKEGSVLEIGCGLGAITSVLCDKCHDVTAVELSKRRAAAALLRCREKENLEIIVGNLNDIKFDKKFDYITLIGVLEYQGTFTDTDNPYLDFLMEIKKLLKPDGKLLIAIENKYGLKYWCGAREDHTGVPFEGMNQYTLSDRKVRTFARKELEELVKDSGFANTFFYYPMPDYKLPTIVYSQDSLPDNENMHNLLPYYIPDKITLVADEMAIYKDVIANGAFEFFANSFLVECSDSEDLGKVTRCSLSSERLLKYRIATVFTKDGTVEKFPLYEEGAAHVAQISKNGSVLEKRGRKVLPAQLLDGRLVSEYVKWELAEERLLDACRRKNKFEFYRILDRVYQEILASSEHIAAEENIICTMDIDKDSSPEKYGPILRVGYLDMILRNAFNADGDLVWFDQEWVLESVPANFIFYRAVKEFYFSYQWVDKIISLNEVGIKYNLVSAWNNYRMLEGMFLDTVVDMAHVEEAKIYRGGNKQACLENIKKLMRMA